MVEKFWNENVKSNAIGGVIAGLILAALLWFLRGEWWPVAQNGITSTWHGIGVAWAYLLGTTTIRRWKVAGFMVGTGLSVLLIAGLIVILWKAKKEAQDTPEWLSYTSDNFYELKWVWAYEGRKVSLKAVVCLRCGFQLGPDNASPFASRVSFYCNSCGRNVPVEGYSWQSLQSVVKRLIEQKLRLRTYPKATRESGP